MNSTTMEYYIANHPGTENINTIENAFRRALKHVRYITMFGFFLAAMFGGPVFAATITVDTLGDTGAAPELCELRSAIMASQTAGPVDGCIEGAGDDEIVFSVTGTIVLLSDLPSIGQSVAINGPGQDDLVISGDNTFRQISFSAQALEIRGLTLADGFSTLQGGCINLAGGTLLIEDARVTGCVSTTTAGAIRANGETSILRSTFDNNSAGGNAGAIAFTSGTNHIIDSTFHSNTAVVGLFASAGAVLNFDGVTLNIVRSTFTANKANRDGGAIRSDGTLNIGHSTIAGNTADADASETGDGGGLNVLSGVTTITNTVMSNNNDLSTITNVPDVFVFVNGSISTNGYNFIGNNATASTAFPGGAPNVNNDYVGVPGDPLDAELEILDNFEGPTQTMPPQATSSLVDQGNCPGEVADQRGISNPLNGLRPTDREPADSADGCDIGAVELHGDWILVNGFES